MKILWVALVNLPSSKVFTTIINFDDGKSREITTQLLTAYSDKVKVFLLT